MRVPPNNADAEKSVLGCMMQDREALSLAFELLTADDFYQPANREIFDAMHALNTQGMPIDLVTVDDELTRRGTLEGVGGTNYLIELSQCMPSTVNARAYVQIVDCLLYTSLPHARSAHEGAQEVRPQGCTPRAAVLQALIRLTSRGGEDIWRSLTVLSPSCL